MTYNLTVKRHNYLFLTVKGPPLRRPKTILEKDGDSVNSSPACSPNFKAVLHLINPVQQ